MNEQIVISSRNSVNLVSFSGDKTSTLGTCDLPLIIAEKNVTLTFQVVKIKKKTLLGLTDALRLGLLTLHPEVHEVDQQHENIPPDIYEKYSELFSDLPGTLPVVYKMKLQCSVNLMPSLDFGTSRSMKNQVTTLRLTLHLDAIVSSKCPTASRQDLKCFNALWNS